VLLFLPGERESTKAEIEWSDLCSGGARRIVMAPARFQSNVVVVSSEEEQKKQTQQSIMCIMMLWFC